MTDFRIFPAPFWDEEAEKEIGTATIEALKRHGVSISGLRGSDIEEETAAAAQAAAETTMLASGVRVVIEEAASTSIAGFTTWAAISGRTRSSWSWAESTADGQLSQSTATEIGSRGAMVWTVAEDTRPTATASMSVLQMIALDSSPGDASITKVQKMLGTDATVLPLTPAVGNTPAALIAVVVPANTSEMLMSNLRLRFPKMIFRS